MIFKVCVKPGSLRDSVEKTDEGFLVRVRARAEGGKANLAVVRLLARELRVSAKNIKVKTFRGRNKIVEVK